MVPQPRVSIGRALVVFGLLVSLLGCVEEQPYIGNRYDVGCGNAAAMEIEDQVFDLRPVNNCGMGLIRYDKTVTSISGEVVAELRIECSVGFCIGNVEVRSWIE